VLAKVFHITADEAMFVRPAWELNNLLERHLRDVRAEQD